MDPRPLALYIRTRMSRLGLTQRALAGELGHKAPGLVSHVLSGRKAIPPQAIDKWIEALRIPPEERERFRTWAIAESGNDQLQQRVSDLENQAEAHIEMLRLLLPKVIPGITMDQVDALLNERDPVACVRLFRRLLRASPEGAR